MDSSLPVGSYLTTCCSLLTVLTLLYLLASQLKALSQSFSRTRDAYNECQAEIVRKAVEVAATFAPVFREIAETIGMQPRCPVLVVALCFE